MISKWFLRPGGVVDVVHPQPGRRRYADRPADTRPPARTDRAERRGGNGGRTTLQP
jgi:hypothetical protein